MDGIFVGPSDLAADFGFLQMRPLICSREIEDFAIESIPPATVLCQSSHVLGNGRIEDIHDVVVVDYESFHRSSSVEVAEIVARLNAQLIRTNTPYILIGVGRWGSKDPWLGIPVTWDQVSGARVIVEAGFRDFRVTPSQGSHFFQNLTAFHIAYFTINPDLGEGHLALGLYYYWTESNYERALLEFATAGNALPNDIENDYFSAAIRRRQGRWNEHLDLLKKCQSVDPGNANVMEELAYTYSFLHEWSEAARARDRLVELAPNSYNAKIQRALIDFWSAGDTAPLAKVLAAVPSSFDPSGLVTRARWDVAMIRRDYAAADRVLSESAVEEFHSDGQPMPKSFYRGCVALARGDSSTAKTHFDAALPLFEAAVRESPGTGLRHANLGLLYSFMGRKDDAIREGRRAVELEPASKDAVVAPWMSGFLAMIYVRVGEANSAIQLLESLLSSPGPVDNTNCSITSYDLRHRWQWDPLRNDPRFQNLLAQSESKPAQK